MSRLDLTNAVAGAFDARAPFAVEIGAFTGLKLHLAVRGKCWLEVEGEKEALCLSAGDCVLFTKGLNATFASAPGLAATVHRETLVARAVDGVLLVGGGGAFFGIGLHVEFAGHFLKLLFARLPPVIVVSAKDARANIVRAHVEAFRDEYVLDRPGRAVAIQHLSALIVLDVLRSHVDSEIARFDWLWALADPKLSRAIAVIHDRYAEAWTTEKLAAMAGMSRSSFATAFTRSVGLGPIEYLTQWRVQVACDLLGAEDLGLAEVAERLGYRSESAFSAAFTAIVRCRPGLYARRARARARRGHSTHPGARGEK